jgi:NAD(P)H-dependent FMN reductase
MKVLALNSSPRGAGQSKTEWVLSHLVRGMREAGAEVEVVALREKTIKNCIGCYTCWTKTPGTCIHKDEMTSDLFPKWLEADLCIYATPLYNYAVTAALKTFMERTLPSCMPFFETHAGRMFHPARLRRPPLVILSVAGMPDPDHFGPLSAHMNYAHSSPGNKLVAEIYRPAAELMANPMFREKANEVLQAFAQGGRELVESMKISGETMKRITQPISDPQSFMAICNAMWKTCIAEGVTRKQFDEKGMIPRPDSLQSFLLIFPFGINAKAAGDRTVVVSFAFSGAVEGSCYFTVEKGTVKAHEGTWEGPDIVVEAPFDVWMDVMTGKADGRQMLMEQKYKVSGDLPLMMQLLARK